ncbi:hypothetical protein N8696_00785 [bacterium]|nr:hypothetical protein [bacterium]MDA7633956.1 hypothetical protein [bacterium]
MAKRPKSQGLGQQAPSLLTSLELKSLPFISQQREHQAVATQALSLHQGELSLMRSLDMLRHQGPAAHCLRSHRIQENKPIQTTMSVGMGQLLSNTTTLRIGMGANQSSPTPMAGQQPVPSKARRNHNAIP